MPTEVPEIDHPRWRQVVTGEKTVEVENLGLRLLLSTIALRRKRDGSEATVKRNAEELRAFFLKHALAVENDLQRLFS
jgi:hypothetical protein